MPSPATLGSLSSQPHAPRTPRRLKLRRAAWGLAGVGVYALAMVLVVNSCGYFQAGTWVDDSKNWERAFGAPRPPDEMEVVHSYYERSAHWTYEYIYFFQLRLGDRSNDEILGGPSVRRVERERDGGLEDSIPWSQAPPWFAPGDASRYEGFIIYREAEQRTPEILVLRDPVTKDLFIYSSQL